MPSTTCQSVNGTYVCQRPEGHTGEHCMTYAVGRDLNRCYWGQGGSRFAKVVVK